MDFPIYPQEYQPTSTKDTYKIRDGKYVQYSESSDTILSVPDDTRGKYTLLHAGDDFYVGSVFDSVGYDNIANGNRGADILTGNVDSRDYLRGGKDDDLVEGMNGGDDLLMGDMGDDIVNGSLNGHNIIRGGKGDDDMAGGNQRDSLIGDPGKDNYTGGAGSDFFVLRTDNEDDKKNLTPNASECDIINDFSSVERDYVVLTGVSSSSDYKLTETNGDTYIEIMNGATSLGYAGRVAGVVNMVNANFLIGDTANSIYNVNDEDFLSNSNILDSFAAA